MRETFKPKVVLTFFTFCILFALVVTKAMYIQIINADKLLAYSDSQFIRKVKVYPKRANILDRNGDPLAINVQTYSVFTIPKSTAPHSYKTVATILPGMNYRDILKKIKGREKYTWLARKIKLTDAQVEKLKKIEGIYVEAIPNRLYPNHEVAGQILGFVGVDNNGLAGLEYSLDERLKGEPQIIKYYKDAKGRPVQYVTRPSNLEVQDVTLSIDKEIQAAVEKYLKEGVLLNDGEKGGAAVMDARTGEILAMANYPTFDPNDPKKNVPGSSRLSFVSDPFEPGSTFKAITIASAIENKIVNRDSSYYCEKGKMRVEDHVISEALESERFEWLTVEEIFKFSSNVGTTKIAFDLTFPRLKKSILSFNFGKKTGIELPAESKGIFTDKENVRPLSLSTISFGQGIATTGIQMISAYASIANGGDWVRPTLLKVTDEAKVEKRRIMSHKTSESMQKMLIKAVEEGTGGNAKIPHFLIGGKTSTSQKVSVNGGYDGYISGFIGFPINVDRKFVIYVYVDNPKKGAYFGGAVAAPIFKKIAQFVLYKREEFTKIAHVPTKENNTLHSSSVSSVDMVHTTQAAYKREEQGKIPNFVGLDKVSSLEMAKRNQLDVEAIGYGLVRRQVPEPGSANVEVKSVKLFFEAPAYD